MSTLLDMVKEQLPSEPLLSFSRSDIERRIAFPAGRFTSPGPLLAPLMAVILSVAFYGAISLAPESQATTMFTRSPVIPAVIVFLTAWSLMILLIKGGKLSLQRKALTLKLLPTEDPGFILTPNSAEHVLKKLYTNVDDPQSFLLTRRIHNALANLRNVGRIGDVAEVLRTQAETDEGQIDSSYTVLRGFIWAIPVLGFIGTVLGLSVAMGSFDAVLTKAGEMEQLRGALRNVVGGLSTAFETTLQGLVAAICIHLFMTMTRRREEQFLDSCKDYCQKYIVGRLRLTELDERGTMG